MKLEFGRHETPNDRTSLTPIAPPIKHNPEACRRSKLTEGSQVSFGITAATKTGNGDSLSIG
jgi:hypothetical protein